jgi:hypothetical protein
LIFGTATFSISKLKRTENASNVRVHPLSVIWSFLKLCLLLCVQQSRGNDFNWAQSRTASNGPEADGQLYAHQA